jgi:hypothetical protein|nr:MAG TPA: hypothetical protein [Caudoviricetes sp.]DAS33982.1 MAG TPA: hypothetical protein [Caudoviricetes sp.]DAU34190.1 MAG TPA: hypothetical protein [Caudoviricetes sp.]
MVADILEVLNFSNDYKIGLNMSYSSLMDCSLCELEYWSERGKKLIEDAEERAERSNRD